jgi:hypothetical protein
MGKALGSILSATKIIKFICNSKGLQITTTTLGKQAKLENVHF